MFIVEVSPIDTRARVQTLTYFTPIDTPIGTVVDAPLRSKQVRALVIACTPAQTVRSAVRGATFNTKKLSSTAYRHLFTDACIIAAQHTAAWYATSIGSVLRECIPAALLNDATLAEVSRSQTRRVRTYEIRALQASYEERISSYRTTIRETLASHDSVFVLVPTAHEATRLKAALGAGIASRIATLTNSMSKKQQRDTWEKARTQTQPIVIIATAGFLGIPRDDIALYIVERERASGYKRMTAPCIDMRYLVQELARASKSTLLLADSLLRLDTHAALNAHEAEPYEIVSRRVKSGTFIELYDTKTIFQTLRDKNPTAQYPILVPQLDELLHSSARKHIIILAVRKGLAPATICGDCGAYVHCPHCDANMVLHEGTAAREFLCHRCGTQTTAHTRCSECNSWKLTPLGVGIERIEAHIRSTHPQITCRRVDAETTRTPKQIEEAVRAWQNGGGILLGTETMLPYLDIPYDYAIYTAFDALFSVPDFRIDERIFGTITTLREQAREHVYIQTRYVDHPVLTKAVRGAIAGFVHDELIARKKLNYPPYAVIIKVTCTGSKTEVIAGMQQFAVRFAKHKPRIFGDFIPAPKNQFALHALLRIRADAWPKDYLVALLESLPPQFSVVVNPSS